MNQPRSCSNCGHDAEGRFCPHCGQSTREFKLPLTQFLAEFAGEAFALDSRLLNTIKPLFLRPGYVSAEFVAGKRERFLPPARLYLLASFTVFLAMALNPKPVQVTTTRDGVRTPATIEDFGVAPNAADSSEAEGDGSGLFLSNLSERFAHGLERVTEDPTAFRRVLSNRMAQAMFILLPVFALLLKLAYRSRLYVEHLVYSVYFHSFAFIVFTLTILPSVVDLDAVKGVAGLLPLGLPFYLFMGMRRMYGESRARTAVKFAGVGLAYSVLLVGTGLVTLTLTLLTV